MFIRKVTYRTGWDAMHTEMQEHWDEVPFGNFILELDINHNTYMTAEEEGYASYYLGYNDEGEPVAYMSVFANEMCQHKGTMQAVADCFYVAPDYRRKGMFDRMIKFVEADLKQCGIRFFTIGHNPNTKEPVDKALEHKGYAMTEISYTKEL